MNSEVTLSAVVLAGGASKRMGRNKAWVECDGQPLLALAVAKVRALGIHEIFISGRAGEDYADFKCPVLYDLEPGFGPLGGIERGLHECTSSLLLVLAVDLPRMTVAFLQALWASCDRLTGGVPKLGNGPEPLVAIYPKRCHALAFGAITESRLSARDFADACLHERAVKAFPAAVSNTGCFANWNSPTDIMTIPSKR